MISEKVDHIIGVTPWSKMKSEIAIEIICAFVFRSSSREGRTGKKIEVEIVPAIDEKAIVLDSEAEMMER